MLEILLARIAAALESRGLPYMLIGGQAVLLYGEPRLTRDIDITVGGGPERLPDVLAVVRDVGATPLIEPAEDFVNQTMVLPASDPASGLRVDFIFSTSPYERQALERARRVRVGGQDVCFAAVEDLIVHKIIAGRPRDLEDVRGVLLRNPEADVAYIRHWLAEFEQALAEPYPKRFEEVRRDLEKP